MRRSATYFFLLIASVVVPAGAHAGWVVQWNETAVRHNGERLETQPSTMSISKGQVRIAQPLTTSVLDYGKKTFTILNPNQSYFWSGTLDEYVTQMSRDRSVSLHKRMGTQAEDLKFERGKVDLDKLPPISIAKTDVTETIAGHPTTKYEIRAEGELLLEVWLAEDVKVSGDLDPKLFLDYEARLSQNMLGASAKPFAALYRNEEYRKLLERGYFLKSITHHGAGSYERVATEIRPQDVPETEFAVPETYRRVRLSDVLPSAPS
jgi:hypothetical protein